MGRNTSRKDRLRIPVMGRTLGQIHIPLGHTSMPKADLPCRVCGRVFKTDDGLTHHMKNKHGENICVEKS